MKPRPMGSGDRPDISVPAFFGRYQPGQRVPSKPLFVGDVPVYKFDNRGNLVTKWVTLPGGTYKNGRCVEWRHFQVPVQRHVLDYTPAPHFPSKHARGRMRPRTSAEQRRYRRLNARITQLQKTMTVDARRFGVIFDEVSS